MNDRAQRAEGLIPAPRTLAWGAAVFDLPSVLGYRTTAGGREGDELRQWLREAPFFSISFKEDERNPLLELLIKPGLPPEGYELRAEKDKITIEAADTAGLFYGLQSLDQLCADGKLRVVHITDAPRFAWRGFMLDVSRHFRSTDFIKRQLDLMARCKLNRFHWHLTDAAGWRIEIKAFPELTAQTAWRPYPDWAAWDRGGRRYCLSTDPSAQGGFYTQDEIRDIVVYARMRHITVIPEIEMPGHSDEVFAVFPELSCGAQGGSDFCIGNTKSFDFIEQVLTEVLDLFPSPYIHIGGDEASKLKWDSCPLCTELMHREGLKNADELQSHMIRRVARFLESKGRRLIGWDEITEGGAPPNAAVMFWRNGKKGFAAAETNPVIMSPSDYCYLNAYQDSPEKEPLSAPSYLTLEKAYTYDPLPADREGLSVLGIEGCLWCEHILEEAHAEHMIWPRLFAIAENGWSSRSQKDYDRFYALVRKNVAWMKKRGLHPFDPEEAAGPRLESRELVSVLSTGKPCTYLSPFHPTYAGEGALTDGLRGDWHHTDGRWQGWLESPADVIIDLEKIQPVSRIAACFMQSIYAWIWLPCKVSFSISDDGENFILLAALEHAVSMEYVPICYKEFCWTGRAHGRYVRLSAQPSGKSGGWIFTDELIVE